VKRPISAAKEGLVTQTVFFDTNIFVYLYTKEAQKSDRAAQLVSQGGIISVQVLNEFVSVAQKKLKLPWDHIETGLEAIRSVCRVLPLDLAIHNRAVEICRRTHYSIYDALILAAALTSGCNTLYSEDLQDRHQFDGLTIINPFRSA